MLLAIDTSTQFAGVALHCEGRLLSALSWHSTQNHTVELMPAIDDVLRRAGAKASDVTGLALALGPGGFSALRVGMSVAKGLAVALEVPVVGVGTLEMEAYPYASTGLPLCPLLGAGRGEVAAALFQEREGQWVRLQEEHLCTPEELAASVVRRTLFCGEAAPNLAGFLKERLGQKAVAVSFHSPGLRLAALASLGGARLAEGKGDDVATLQPIYLRRPSIGPLRQPQRVKP